MPRITLRTIPLICIIGLVTIIILYKYYNTDIQCCIVRRSELMTGGGQFTPEDFVWSNFENISKASNTSEKNSMSSNIIGHPEAKRQILAENSGMVCDCISGNNVRNISRTTRKHFNSTINHLPITVVETSKERQQSFEGIYREQIWGRYQGPVDKKVSSVKGSGPGSTLYAAQGAITVLNTLIDHIKIKHGKDQISLLDIPCGDLVWMNTFLEQRTDIIYTGMDIVPNLIENHNSTFQNNARISFILQDVVDKPLEDKYDIIFCRMLLQHLTILDVMKVLSHFSQSRSNYLLVTTHPGVSKMYPIALRGARFRFLNLEIPPVQLEPPICISRDASPDTYIADHYLGLWKLPFKQFIYCKIQRIPMARGPNFDSYACV